jgi:hypothetical protein
MSSNRKSSALLCLSAMVMLGAVSGLKTAGRRLLAQNCPATYPIYYAGTCFLCPEANPVFSNLQCYANDAQKASGKNGVKATPQPIKDPKPTSTSPVWTGPAIARTVDQGQGSVITYSCANLTLVLWNKTCCQCPEDHPFFSDGKCYSDDPTASTTNPASAAAAAQRQKDAGHDPNPGGGSLMGGGR